MYNSISNFELDTVHDGVRHVAQPAAEAVGQAFDEAGDRGQIRLNDLMVRSYQPIRHTAPTKHSTRFDKFTDQILPSIQEPVLQQHDFMLYAGAVGDHGYLPTHRKRYSKALAGDYQTDLANSRTKHIFRDRTGLRCGQNGTPFLLQTYKRDTGEIMHDMSAPIFLKGHHWGGFRIGYKAE